MILNSLIDTDIKQWLEEDTPFWDVSSIHTDEKEINASIIAKQDGIVAGIDVAQRVFQMCGVETTIQINDGEEILDRDPVLTLQGPKLGLLQAERTGLNILSHMSGIATYTNSLVQQIKEAGLATRLAATRKTLPGLRKYQKWAVKMGGGDTHRMTLSSMALIKENHILTYGGIKEAVKVVQDNISFSNKIEIEVRTHDEAVQASMLDVDIIMLDNFTIEAIKETLPVIRENNKKILVEASGNINETTFLDYAQTGVDIISMGKLTHSVSNFDYSLIVNE